MKPGTKVVVCHRRGDATITWSKGVVLGSRLVNHETILNIGVGEKHYFNYKEEEFSSHSVKRFEELPQEQADMLHAEQLPLALAMAEKALATLLPEEKLEVKDGYIFGYGGSVTLDPVVYEVQTIGAVREVAGWCVTKWKRYPATRVQPEEVLDDPVGQFPNYGQAVQKFIEVIFAMKSADYWQAQADDALAGFPLLQTEEGKIG